MYRLGECTAWKQPGPTRPELATCLFRSIATASQIDLSARGFPLPCCGRTGGESRLRASGERAMKVLFVWDSAEYLRFFDSVVDECLARGHEVAIAYNKTNIKKLGGLRGLRAIEGRVRVLGLVPRHKGMWRRIAYGLRGTMDFVRYFHPRFTVATAARARSRRGRPPCRWSVTGEPGRPSAR